jgi:hypothetical protein
VDSELFPVDILTPPTLLAAAWSKKRESLEYLIKDDEHLKTRG